MQPISQFLKIVEMTGVGGVFVRCPHDVRGVKTETQL